MASEATGRDSDKFMLRLPNGMRDRLRAAAEDNKRSMNAEIVARLEASLSGPKLDRTSLTPRQVEAVSHIEASLIELLGVVGEQFAEERRQKSVKAEGAS